MNFAIPDFCTLISDRDEWKIAKPLVQPDFVSGSQYPAIRTTAG